MVAGLIIALAVFAAVGLLASPPAGLIDWLGSRFPGCLYQVRSRARVVALTIDDSPDSATTALLLDELRRHRAGATFFVITSRVPGREDLLRRIRGDGHEIGNHFTQDRPGIQLDAAVFAEDLEQAGRTLEPYGASRWARPGSGWYSHTMIEAMARQGYQCALGSVYPYDAAIPSARFASWFIRRNVRPGAILILHDGGRRGMRTVRVLQSVLPWLEQQGYRVVTLSELITTNG